MTKFYFIRHGETDFTLADTKIYKNWGFNMLPLSNKGVEQIKATAKDKRLKMLKSLLHHRMEGLCIQLRLYLKNWGLI